jgi:3-hydroxymyristoyl/3-hydroxydecanoyl-(acyl carrier protein) dehydratase
VNATVEGGSKGAPEIFFLAAANMKYTHPAYPEDVLRLTAETDRSFGNFHTFNVEASVGRHLITKGSLTLAMMESL